MNNNVSTLPTPSVAQCETCPLYNNAQLVKLGINMTDWDYIVALAGNPNTGKSTVFNALTGLRQHTGNWPGKTVTRAEGGYLYGDKHYKLVDLPGTYSLLSTSVDEEVARDFILFGQPTVTVVVADATRLERNLNLVLQVLEITDRVVIALNLMDEAKRHGLEVDERKLSRELGVPAVPMVARRGEGVEELLSTIAQVADGSYKTRPHRIKQRDPKLEAAVTELTQEVKTFFPGLPNARWVAMRLLDGDESIIHAVQEKTLGDLTIRDRGRLEAALQPEAVS
ncbi:MAG: FeoB small GTPase domain-containing protein [Candidatus Promineifilaceae bacterium]